MPAPLAIQLYTVRNVIAQRDYAAVVKEIAALGYAGVEPAGFPGTTVAEAAKLFRDLGLQVSSFHGALPVGDKEAEALDTARTLGATRLVSGKGPDEFKTVAGIHRACDQFNEAAANARQHGMTFSIHNHWWEFEQLGDRRVYEIMLERLTADVLFELDVYWIQTGGCDPATVIKRLGSRAPLLHIKDGPCVQGQPMTAVGAGKVNMSAVAAASAATAQWWIVELDDCATDMMQAVRESYVYLTGNGLAKGTK